MRHTTSSVDFFYRVSPFDKTPSPEAELIEGWHDARRVNEVSVILAALTTWEPAKDPVVAGLLISLEENIDTRKSMMKRKDAGFTSPISSVRIERTELGPINQALKQISTSRRRLDLLLLQADSIGTDMTLFNGRETKTLLHNSNIVTLTSLGAASLSTTIEPYIPEPALTLF